MLFSAGRFFKAASLLRDFLYVSHGKVYVFLLFVAGSNVGSINFAYVELSF